MLLTTEQLMGGLGLRPSDLWYLQAKFPAAALKPVMKAGNSYLWKPEIAKTVRALRQSLSNAGRPRKVEAAAERTK